MLRIAKNHHVFTMSAKNPAVAAAKSGDVILFETKDCYSDQLQTEEDLFGSVCWDQINPATGPVYIEDAKPGDTLRVEVIKIKPAMKGTMSLTPGCGVMGGRISEEVTKIFWLENEKVVFDENIVFDTCPMIGVIGTAPANGEEIPTGTPGAHGGNMDCKEITEGTTVFLPVNVEGGLLSMGDVHTVMGDGEVGVCGLEAAAEITVRVTVEKGLNLPMPFLMNHTHVMTVCAGDTLDEAGDEAVLAMHRFLTESIGMESAKAAMLLSLKADLKICQIVNPKKTCRVELPIAIFSDEKTARVNKLFFENNACIFETPMVQS